MEMLGAITGLIGAGLQAQAQHDQLMFQYAKFNWEKQRANKQDRFAQASRSDQYGNKTAYDELMNEWKINLTPDQQKLMKGGEKEQLLQLTKDAPAARKIKEAVQKRAYDAKEPYHKAALGYQYDQPRSEGAIRSELSTLMATNDMMKTKADQAIMMRQAARLGRGVDASKIIASADQKLGNAGAMNNRALQARNEALKEFSGRQQLHEAQWGSPMKVWGELMAQGGEMPGMPRSNLSDSTGAQQQAMLQAFNAGTRGVSGAFDSLGAAAGKSVDLSGVAKALAGIGKGGGSGRNSKGQVDNSSYGGMTEVTDWDGTGRGNFAFSDYGNPAFDPSRNEWGSSSGSGSLF